MLGDPDFREPRIFPLPEGKNGASPPLHRGSRGFDWSRIFRTWYRLGLNPLADDQTYLYDLMYED